MMPYLPKALNPDPTLWDQLRNNFETLGPGYLFNIANQSEITSEDVEKMHEIVSFYVGSIDNINEEHMDAMIDMFTDAGISRLHHSSPLVITRVEFSKPNIEILITVTKALKLRSFKASVDYIIIIFIIFLIIFIIMAR